MPLPPSTNSASQLLYNATSRFPALPTEFSMLRWAGALQPVSQNKLSTYIASCEVLGHMNTKKLIQEVGTERGKSTGRIQGWASGTFLMFSSLPIR